MHRKSLLWHIFLPFLTITLLTLLLVSGYASRVMRNFHLEHTGENLVARSSLFAQQIQPLVAGGEHDEVQELCVLLGARSKTRFTVIAPDGTVIGDTDEKPERMENHADRPEIMAALGGQIGQATRYSATLQHTRMYVAIPGYARDRDRDHVSFVVRSSLAVDDIGAALRQVFWRMALAGLMLALLSGLISYLVARRISVPLRRLQSGAERFARGELGVRLLAPDSEEIGALAEAMNEMARQLSERIDTIVEQRNEYQAVLASMVEGVLAIDCNETILGLNRAGARLLAVDVEASVGQSIQAVVRNSDLLSLATETLGSGEPVEGDIVLNRGGEIFVQVHATSLTGPDGRGLGALLVMHDVTRLRRLETMRRDFVANVSHELRTPITSIKGFVETLLDTPPENREEGTRFLQIILKQAERLNAIIADLLSLARIEQEVENAAINLTSTDICDLIHSAVTAVTAGDADVAGRIVVACPDDPDDQAELTATVNAPLLGQAIVNLIDNALKYSEPDTQVVVSGFQRDRQIGITVRDHGRGIEERHIARLFERFYRVDRARSRKLGGTGLGLAIVKHIVQAHHGEIEVESEVGKGSTFTILMATSAKMT